MNNQITKEQIISKVQLMLKNNPQINSFFHPLIEEFFVRMQEQYNFTEKELDEKIEKYKIIDIINFLKVPKHIRIAFLNNNIYLYIQKDPGGFIYNLSYIDMYRIIKSTSKVIYFDKDELKKILLGNRKNIIEFIDFFYHENVHFIQAILEKMQYKTGLINFNFTRRIETLNVEEHGRITNEFATIINAKRLTDGNTSKNKYRGYEGMQNISRAVFVSMGITDEKLGQLQMQGREEYEKYIEKLVGKDYREDLLNTENALDNIDFLDTEIFNTHLFKRKELKQKLAIQFEIINEISNKMLRRRITELGDNTSITQLAQIVIDKRKRDKNLLQAIKEFRNQLPFGFKIDVEPDLIENFVYQYIDKEKLEQEIQKLQQEEIERQRQQITYDNSVLIDRIIQAAQNYDLSQFSLADRIQLNICKQVGKIRRLIVQNNIKQLTEGKTAEQKIKESREEMKGSITTGPVYAEKDSKKIKKDDGIAIKKEKE